MWIRLWSWKKKSQWSSFPLGNCKIKSSRIRVGLKKFTHGLLCQNIWYIYFGHYLKNYVQYYIIWTSEKLKGCWIKCYKMFIFYLVFFKYLFAFKRVYGSLSLDFYNHILNSYWVFKKFYSALYHTKKLLSLYNFEIELSLLYKNIPIIFLIIFSLVWSGWTFLACTEKVYLCLIIYILTLCCIWTWVYMIKHSYVKMGIKKYQIYTTRAESLHIGHTLYMYTSRLL